MIQPLDVEKEMLRTLHFTFKITLLALEKSNLTENSLIEPQIQTHKS